MNFSVSQLKTWLTFRLSAFKYFSEFMRFFIFVNWFPYSLHKNLKLFKIFRAKVNDYSDFSIVFWIFSPKSSFSIWYLLTLSFKLFNSISTWLFSTLLVFFKVSNLKISFSFSFSLSSENFIWSIISLISLLNYKQKKYEK